MKHHHVVMTLPKALRHIRKLNGDLLYNILFTESSKVLQEWFEKKHAIKPGIVSVLHTAGSDLKDHPHVHMIVSRGGLDLNNKSIKEVKGNYLTRQRFLAKKFSKRFISQLLKQYDSGNLKVAKRFDDDGLKFKKWLNNISEKQWIVSIQKPLSDIEKIVGYVGRYTKRACISEYKLRGEKNGLISFVYNDYKNSIRGEKPKQSIKTMKAEEFLDELLYHVPTKRFRMVRYYGSYASAYKKLIPSHDKDIDQDQNDQELEHSWGEFEELRKEELSRGKPDPLTCPNCKTKMEWLGVYYHGQNLLDDP